MAHGVSEYDRKGALRRKYLAFFFDGNPMEYPLSASPAALNGGAVSYGRQRYDAFGRANQTYDVDGTVSMTARYHALSTDVWDAADIGPGPHEGSYATSTHDGHGRLSVTTERFHVGGEMENRYVRYHYLPTGEVEATERLLGSLTSPQERVAYLPRSRRHLARLARIRRQASHEPDEPPHDIEYRRTLLRCGH